MSKCKLKVCNPTQYLSRFKSILFIGIPPS
uniref:Uncharacterized protein n=1 Tax=Siphoviridae sp. ctXZx16 TaxID=2826371 RepID=A0A8S5MLN7_9CAUD|nr:MAG TPA: hypothetical protein [Siphoviridae sp. ctXZx16]DAE83948.1 MAG TPA: hypothetical protein [Bacteriophage sp.]